MKKHFASWWNNNKKLVSFISSLIFNIVTLILSIIGLIGYKSDLLFFVIFFIPYVLSLFLLIITYINITEYNKIKENYYKNTNFIFNQNAKPVISKLKDCENNLWNSYNEFCQEIEKKHNVTEGSEPELDESDIQSYYKEIKKTSNTMFLSVVESIKEIMDSQIELDEHSQGVSVCIKQLDRCYKKKSTAVPDDLHVFAIYRDRKSYGSGREIGKLYTVNRNTTFRSCIMAKESRKAYYLENDIVKAIQQHRYECENEDEILADKTYNATMVVPISQNILTEKTYYGFLCVDINTDKEDIFVVEHFLPIMQFYADILATYYHNVTMYFPIVFDNFYHQKQKTIKGDSIK